MGKNGNIYTAMVGENSNLFPDILKLYVELGANVADVTYGKGVFWKDIDEHRYRLHPTDITTGIDLGVTPHGTGSMDAFILDPPYARFSTLRRVQEQYNINGIRSKEDVMKLYQRGIREAFRVLRYKGILIVKCQDEVVGGRQRWNHILIMRHAEDNGFRCEDLFVMVQVRTPPQPSKNQIHAKKNHSYFLVFRRLRNTSEG